MTESPREWPKAEMTEIVMPGDTNHLGTAFGGKIMQWIDICAAIAAQRHAGGVVVTASIDSLEFRKPIRQGDIVTLKACVNASWTTSMEVGVKVEAENPLTRKKIQACKAYLTFVALDETGQRRQVPGLPAYLGRDEMRRAREAEQRRKLRLTLREKQASP
jgi:acyl-CoA hydrolase